MVDDDLDGRVGPLWVLDAPDALLAVAIVTNVIVTRRGDVGGCGEDSATFCTLKKRQKRNVKQKTNQTKQTNKKQKQRRHEIHLSTFFS